MKQNKKGFTLIELLVVISIIAVLMSILMPALGKVKRQAQKVVCQANLRQLGLSSMQYANENRNKYPHGMNIDTGNGGRDPVGLWPFGGPWYEGSAAGPQHPAGFAVLLREGFLEEPEYMYCPLAKPSGTYGYLSYESVFVPYQTAYLDTGDFKDLDIFYFYTGYLYWSDYYPGGVTDDTMKEIRKNVADDTLSRSDTVVLGDPVVSNSALVAGDYTQAGKCPDPFASHVLNGELEGGSQLHNDMSVEWDSMSHMEEDWEDRCVVQGMAGKDYWF